MDKSTHVTLGGFLAGIVVGFGGGVLFQLCRAAWKGTAAAKRVAAAAGASARSRTVELVVLGFFLLVVAALALGQIGQR